MHGTKPEHCAIVVGIPLTKQEYVAAHDDTIYRDLTQRQSISWPRFERALSRPFEKVAPEFERLGVTIARSATLSGFHSAFHKPDIRVVILISHWQRESIEFFDGMKSIVEITNGIPEDFDGVLDLCICHPLGMAKLIRELRPNCLVRLTNIEVKPVIWFQFYRCLFHFLATENLSYLDAFEKTLKIFNNLR
ncbi:MAG: hypothetical protein ACU836_10075 [Gammaproteobacteria bacterium]